MMAGGQQMASFMAEGGATGAEQYSGFLFEGRMEGQNYDNTVIYSTFGGDEHRYYGFMGDLLAYFGFDFDGGINAGAPEQCTWVGIPASSPCTSVRLQYGPTYSLVQHAIDFCGAPLGGPQAIYRALVDYAGDPGFAALETVFGMPVSHFAATWVLMLYIDDRQMGPALTKFQFPNWNLRSLEDAWATPAAQLTPRARGFADFQDDLSVRGGSFALFNLSGAGRSATAIQATDQQGEPLPSAFQISIVRVE